MKILFVSPSFYPATYYGGPIFSIYELAKALKKQNIDVKVITSNANGKEKLVIKTGIFHYLENNLPVKYYYSLDSKGTSIPMVFHLWKDIKEADMIYLVSVFSPPTPLTLILCSLFKKPLILSPQGQLGEWCLDQGNRFKKQWLKFFIKPFIKRIYWHVTSEDEEKMLKAVYPEAKTFVLPNGIDLESFGSLPVEKNKSFYDTYTGYRCQAKKIIISMGRLHKIKGFDVLIDAFHDLQKEISESVLLIAGEDFGEKPSLNNIINQKKLANEVFLIGKLDGNEKLEFLHNADVFALPSHHENFGMVYAEALAAGIPIIASKNTPWQDAEKFGLGKWVENTPEEFAEAIKQVLNSDSKKMGEIGKKYVEEKFCWEKIARLFIDKINSISSKK